MSNIVIPEVVDRPVEPFPQAVLLRLPRNGKDHAEDVAQFLGHLQLEATAQVIGPDEVVKVSNPVKFFVEREAEEDGPPW